MKFRKAKREDLPAIIEILANDQLGKNREVYEIPLSKKYYEAFERIQLDKGQELIVIDGDENGILGTLQLSFIPYLTYQGGIRTQIEAVRLREDQRGKGIGKLLIEWAVKRAHENGSHLVQLTSDKQRPEAIRFYEKLGFKASHEGMKLHIKN